MPLKKGTIPVVDEYLIQAVKYALDQLGIHPDNLPQKKRRTSLDGIGYGGAGEYNGYFTIKLRTLEDGTQRIVVCDGETYDAENGMSGDSLVMVNGLIRSVPYTEFDIPSNQHRYIYVKYISILEDADSGDRCEIRLGSEDDIAEETAIALIGEITKKESGDISIAQRHGTILSKSTNGVPYIEWTYACEMSYAEN